MSESATIICWGILGGLFAELLGLFRLRHATRENRPTYLKSGFYWLVTIGMIFAGGALTLIYSSSGIILNPLVGVNIGASAPLILGTLVEHAPSQLKTD